MSPAVRDLDRSLGDGGMELLGRLGISFEAYGEGWASATWEPTDLACNVFGTVHGGVFAVMHDAAMNFALTSAIEPGDHAATLDVQYATIRAARPGDPLRTRADVLRLAKRVAYVDSTIRSETGEIISRASGTFAVRRRVEEG